MKHKEANSPFKDEWLYPLYAPMPAPMVVYFLTCVQKAYPEWSRKRLLQETLQRVHTGRIAIWAFLHPYIVSGEITNKRVYLTLQQQVKWSIPQRTLNSWKERRWWRHTAFARPNPDSTAALIILLLSLKALNIHEIALPGSIVAEEPLFWCYRLDAETAHHTPVAVYPVPLPSGIPSSSILVVPWATWEIGWKRVGGLAAIRFPLVESAPHGADSPFQWNVPRTALNTWNPAIGHCLASLEKDPIRGTDRKIEAELIHDASGVVLDLVLRQFWRRLLPLFSSNESSFSLDRLLPHYKEKYQK